MLNKKKMYNLINISLIKPISNSFISYSFKFSANLYISSSISFRCFHCLSFPYNNGNKQNLILPSFFFNVHFKYNSHRLFTIVSSEINPFFRRNDAYKKITNKEIETLRGFLSSPEKQMLTKDEDVEEYLTDSQKLYKSAKVLDSKNVIIFPKTIEELSNVLKFCNDQKIAVCPQGGKTGMVGGGCPVFDELIINMRNFNKIIFFDEKTGILICEAGCILENLNSFLKAKNFIIPLDLGSKGSCHIGGNVATNAGGLRVLRYGGLTSNVLGIESVLPNGNIFDSIQSNLKDNTGLKIHELFIGSEGVLGIITKVVLKCPIVPTSVQLILLKCKHFEDVLNIFTKVKLKLNEILSAVEFFDSLSFIMVLRHLPWMENPFENNDIYLLNNNNEEKESVYGGKTNEIKSRNDASNIRKNHNHEMAGVEGDSSNVISNLTKRNFQNSKNIKKLILVGEGEDEEWLDLLTDDLSMIAKKTCNNGSPFYVIVETHGFDEENDIKRIEKVIDECVNEELVVDGIVVKNNEDLRKIWLLRESISPAMAIGGDVYKFDLSLQAHLMYQPVIVIRQQLREKLGAGKFLCSGYGHIGDNSLHINVVSFFKENKHFVEEILFPWVDQYAVSVGGSISAEHGIGIAKVKQIHLMKNEIFIKLMRDIKNVFDKNNILNPYKLIPPPINPH